ncbi:hypothetical protein [Pyxidicoccus sp. MSG2]|uniref:hypothetical protein n=1 Tax=Pyxidicoccus sp. MSG2 TaxID=2996790 RepID=UPI00226E1F2E|nr:hypothetical protein [Pyxidicoccus sp. MSG2]MCY1015519.1 hypothetical protein [Pyxidicoccus sp. MSG2]
MNPPPPRYDGPFDVFFAQFIEPNLPAPEVVRELHADLRRYVEERDPIFFLRQIPGVERWRRMGNPIPLQAASGERVAFTDNSPQWALHALAYRNALPQGSGFSDWLRQRMPCHMFDIRRDELGETLNDSGWHAAHIFEVKNGDTTWRTWGRDELVRRFIRNVHPCNLLLLSKSDWQRVGRQADLLAFAVNLYRERYGSVLEEARALMSAVAPESGGVPTIRYEAAATAPNAAPNTLVLSETATGRIHIREFGVRVTGLDGQDRFSVAVELLNGTVFGPLNDVSARDLFSRLDVNGEDFRNNKYHSTDYFFVEGESLRGRTRCAHHLAERLNALRRGTAACAAW